MTWNQGGEGGGGGGGGAPTEAQVRTALAAATASIAVNGQAITGAANGVAATDLATVGQVNALVQGLLVKAPVRLATAAALPTNAYVAGVLTATAFGALTVDGVAAQVGDRILVKDEITSANDGIYTVTATGGGAAFYILTRSSDMNQASEFPGAFTLTEQGATNLNRGWTLIADPDVVFVVGTTAQTWNQFTGVSAVAASIAFGSSADAVSLGATPSVTGTLALSRGHYQNLHVTGNTTLFSTDTNSTVRCTGTLTLDSAVSLNADGRGGAGASAASSAGGAGGASPTQGGAGLAGTAGTLFGYGLIVGGVGNNGGTAGANAGADGTDGVTGNPCQAGSAGGSGAGGGGVAVAGANGRTSTNTTATARAVTIMATVYYPEAQSSTANPLGSGGNSGPGGSGGGATNGGAGGAGGASAAGGGGILVAAANITAGPGSQVSAAGLNGSNATAGVAGGANGGGGGGGAAGSGAGAGAAVVIVPAISGTLVIVAAGGAAGTRGGIGAAGSGGGAGGRGGISGAGGAGVAIRNAA